MEIHCRTCCCCCCCISITVILNLYRQKKIQCSSGSNEPHSVLSEYCLFKPCHVTIKRVIRPTLSPVDSKHASYCSLCSSSIIFPCNDVMVLQRSFLLSMTCKSANQGHPIKKKLCKKISTHTHFEKKQVYTYIDGAMQW